MTADKVTADKVSDRQGWLFDRGGLFPRACAAFRRATPEQERNRTTIVLVAIARRRSDG